MNFLLLLPPVARFAVEAGDTLAQAGGHEAAGAPELPNIIQMLALVWKGTFLSWQHWENIIFAFLVLIFMCFIALRVSAKRNLERPGKLQNLVEMLVEALYNFYESILGHHAKKYTPFLGTLFIYILLMNWMGIIPFFKSPSTSATITVSLALVVFVYVQYTGFRRLGVGGWFYHMLGEPSSMITWVLAPFLFAIHIMGELIKPVSLSMRLFGNITGEDALIAAFTGIGILTLSFVHSPVGIPFQFPFYFLGLLMSTIQALVFSVLATIYISMMLPHEEHEH